MAISEPERPEAPGEIIQGTLTPAGDGESIRMSEKHAGILAKLIEIQAGMPAIPQSGKNKFHNYEYSTLGDFVRVLHPILKDHELGLICSTERVYKMPLRKTKNGVAHAFVLVLVMRLFMKNGEWIEIRTFGENQSAEDKSLYGALTGARKYAYLKLFNLESTNDDPEYDRDAREGGDGKPQRGSRKRTTKKDDDEEKETGEDITLPQRKKIAALATKEEKVKLDEEHDFGDVMHWTKYCGLTKKMAADIIERLEERKRPVALDKFLKTIGYDEEAADAARRAEND